MKKLHWVFIWLPIAIFGGSAPLSVGQSSAPYKEDSDRHAQAGEFQSD